MCIEYHIQVNTYYVSAQGIDECMINVHYYCYYYFQLCQAFYIGVFFQCCTVMPTKPECSTQIVISACVVLVLCVNTEQTCVSTTYHSYSIYGGKPVEKVILQTIDLSKKPNSVGNT